MINNRINTSPSVRERVLLAVAAAVGVAITPVAHALSLRADGVDQQDALPAAEPQGEETLESRSSSLSRSARRRLKKRAEAAAAAAEWQRQE